MALTLQYYATWNRMTNIFYSISYQSHVKMPKSLGDNPLKVYNKIGSFFKKF